MGAHAPKISLRTKARDQKCVRLYCYVSLVPSRNKRCTRRLKLCNQSTARNSSRTSSPCVEPWAENSGVCVLQTKDTHNVCTTAQTWRRETGLDPVCLASLHTPSCRKQRACEHMHTAAAVEQSNPTHKKKEEREAKPQRWRDHNHQTQLHTRSPDDLLKPAPRL